MARPVLRSDDELFAGSYLLALAKEDVVERWLGEVSMAQRLLQSQVGLQ